MQESDDEGDGFCFAVVDGRAPGGSTPGASDLWSAGFLDLHVAVWTAIFCEGCEAAKSEAIEEDLER